MPNPAFVIHGSMIYAYVDILNDFQQIFHVALKFIYIIYIEFQHDLVCLLFPVP